jgi:YtkA-like protein
MKPTITAIMVAAAILGGGLVGVAAAAEMKVIQTQKTKDAVVALRSDSGRWTPGSNAFVVEITSSSGQTLDAGKVSLTTSMAMPGMAPMIAGATLTADKTPGRYLGTISFPDSGTRQVTVSWDGPAGKGSVRFSVPVR